MMQMIWQLFGVHIVLIALVMGLFIIWLVWPRRYKVLRRRMIQGSGLILLLSVLLGVYVYWPRSFEKSYLSIEISDEVKETPLRELIDTSDFYIGVAAASTSPHLNKMAVEFNSMVAENEFKPGQLLTNAEHWQYDFSKADQLIAFAEKHNMRMRGHTLIWGKFPGMTLPESWITKVEASPDPLKEMKRIITRYVTDVMQHFKGKVATWDVVNEPMRGEGLYPSIFSKTLGEEYIDLAFRTAHQVDPDCKLYLNEAIVDYDGPPGQAFLSLLKRLLDRNVPLHGVGLQTHHLFQLHDSKALKRYIEEIAEMGLEVEITELDVRLLLLSGEDDPYEAQGKQYKSIVEVCSLSPACRGVTLWGFSDKDNWMDAVPPFKWKSPNAPNIYDEDLNRKPAYMGIWKALSTIN